MLRTILIVILALLVASFVLSILWSLIKGLFGLAVVAAVIIGSFMLVNRLMDLTKQRS